MLSILFADLVGFTPLAETRDPEEVRELLGRYFETTREIVERYGGTLEKFIGDAVVAVWGAPQAQEDDAERAVRTALELVAAVAELGEANGVPLALRVGVSTGSGADHPGRGRPGHGGRRRRQHHRPHPDGGPAGHGVGRRGNAAGDRGVDRLRGRRQLRAEGQGGAGRPVAGPAGGRRAPRRGPLGRPGAAVRRAGARAVAAEAAAARDRPGRARPHGGRVGDRRDRQVAADLGVREVHRRAGRRLPLAPRSVPRLWRRGRVLGAGGDRPHALPDRRGRGRRDGRRQARRDAGRSSSSRTTGTRCGRRCGSCSGSNRSPTATATACSRPGGCSSSG